MYALIGVAALLSAVLLSLLVVRVATIALMLTGLSRDLARFEAHSAFTGAGFTTSDSETVTNHPVRREIILLLMMLGNAGIVTVVSSLVLSFMAPNNDTIYGALWVRLLVLVLGLVLLSKLAYSEWVDTQLSRVIGWALKRFTQLDVRDYVGLLHLAKGYEVAEMKVVEGNWLANQALLDLRLGDEGVLVLGVERVSGNYLGGPKGSVRLLVDDTLLVYGPQAVLSELIHREKGPQGDLLHQESVMRQQDEGE